MLIITMMPLDVSGGLNYRVSIPQPGARRRQVNPMANCMAVMLQSKGRSTYGSVPTVVVEHGHCRWPLSLNECSEHDNACLLSLSDVLAYGEPISYVTTP